MADLSKFWRNQKAIASAEFDQKKMLAEQIICEHYNNDDGEKVREIINFFSLDERLAISLIGILAQVGLCAMSMDDFSVEQDKQ